MSEIIESYFPDIPEGCMDCVILRDAAIFLDIARKAIEQNETLGSELNSALSGGFEAFVEDVQTVARQQYSDCPGGDPERHDDSQNDGNSGLGDQRALTLITMRCPKAVS